MKKSDLKSGMKVVFKDGKERFILLDTVEGDCTCELSEGGVFNCFRLSHYTEDLYCGDYTIMEVYDGYGVLLWKREEEVICVLDGVSYSASTLRSIIKKATR